MANLFTPNIGFVNPGVSDYNWQDEWYRNNDIMDVLFSSLLSQNRLMSGGKVTTTDNLNALYEAGSAWINGVLVSWVEGSLIPSFGPAGLDFYLNWHFVNSAGVVEISATKPTGNYVVLGILDVSNSAILRIFDVRHFQNNVPINITERGNKNYLDNAGPDIWQRGDSQTDSGFMSDDRWGNYHLGVTKNHLKVAFVNGQTDVPGNPKFYSRTIINNVIGANNFATKVQKIEGVQNLAGEKATFSFWARADANKNIALELNQSFGTGGSASVNEIGSQLVSLSTIWQKYFTTIDIPSISDKIIGSDGTDGLNIRFWFNAGSTYSSRAANLGQQSGTFDLCKFRLEAGDKVTEDTPRTIYEELERCKRLYQTGLIMFSGDVTTGFGYYQKSSFNPSMLKAPSLILTNLNAIGFPTTPGTIAVTKSYLHENRIANVTTRGLFSTVFAADAE